MEMEFQDTSSRRRRLFLILGVGLAVVSGLVAYSIGSQGLAAQEPPKTQPVLVATREIPARTTLTADDVTVRQLPEDLTLAAAFSSAEQVVGRVTTVPLFNGQVVYPNSMITTSADAAFSILAPTEVITTDSPNWRAVSVQVPPERAVGGSIMTGQRVDLLISVEMKIMVLDEDGKWIEAPTGEGLQSGKSTRLTIQDLEVLDVQSEEGIYILKVNAEQAEEIYHVANVAPGAFSLALRADGDTRPLALDGYGETNDRLIMEYLFPVPRLLDLVTLTNGEALPADEQPRAPAATPDPAESAEPEAEPNEPEPTPES